jgi:hypothetical protein
MEEDERPTVSKFDANQKFNNTNGEREPTICANLFHWLTEKMFMNTMTKC